jgi:hypothetical protein
LGIAFQAAASHSLRARMAPMDSALGSLFDDIAAGCVPHFDVVVDEVNRFRFSRPLWSDIPVLMFIHQLARQIWWYDSSIPVNLIGFTLEPAYLAALPQHPGKLLSAES